MESTFQFENSRVQGRFFYLKNLNIFAENRKNPEIELIYTPSLKNHNFLAINNTYSIVVQ